MSLAPGAADIPSLLRPPEEELLFAGLDEIGTGDGDVEVAVGVMLI